MPSGCRHYRWWNNPKPSCSRSCKWRWGCCGGYWKEKELQKKIEMSRIALTTYDKVLVELRAALRGDFFNKQERVY